MEGGTQFNICRFNTFASPGFASDAIVLNLFRPMSRGMLFRTFPLNRSHLETRSLDKLFENVETQNPIDDYEVFATIPEWLGKTNYDNYVNILISFTFQNSLNYFCAIIKFTLFM